MGGYIREEHLRGHPEKGRDWLAHVRTAVRQEEGISTAIKSLDPLIHEAVSALHIEADAARICARRGRNIGPL